MMVNGRKIFFRSVTFTIESDDLEELKAHTPKDVVNFGHLTEDEILPIWASLEDKLDPAIASFVDDVVCDEDDNF